ncbi:MAG: hypothetical protein DWP92_07375 [Armatimonadetes bacterium]|nr:MAG: hypothetical protein DWP92_07375 [Armatimonadota bacterium]
MPGLVGSTRNCDRSGFVRLLTADRRPGELRNAREYLLGTRWPALVLDLCFVMSVFFTPFRNELSVPAAVTGLAVDHWRTGAKR